MKKTAITIGIAVLCPLQIIAADRHPFNTRDDIEMNRFGSVSSRYDSNTPASFSPDGKQFVVLTSHGILDSDVIESEVWIYNTRDVNAMLQTNGPSTLRPQMLVSERATPKNFSYESYASIITNIQWAPDSRSLYYLAQNGQGNRSLRKIIINQGHITILTPQQDDVIKYVVTNNAVAYIKVNSDRQWRYMDARITKINRDVEEVDGIPPEKILFPHKGYEPRIAELWVHESHKNLHVSKVEDEQPQQEIDDPLDNGFSISPDGRYVVRLRSIGSIPNGWSSYEPAPSAEHLRIRADKQAEENLLGVGFFDQFVITDVRTQSTEALVEAPVGRNLGYADSMDSMWSSDGKYLLLTNTFLPVDSTSQGKTDNHSYPCLAAVIKISIRDATCLQYFPSDVENSQKPSVLSQKARFIGGNIVVSYREQSGKNVVRLYKCKADHWDLVATKDDLTEERLSATFSVEIHQDLNDPPTLQVVDKLSGHTVRLWNPNPQLDLVEWGMASQFNWKNQKGYEWKGGLIAPLDYKPGKRYPLVIQMYTFHDHQFMTDGTAPTAMPARALASAGIFYLQASKKSVHTWDQREAQDHLDGVVSAIDALDAAGLIDPHKVGIIGFSFTSWYVENELVKAPTRFAAATIAEGADNSYSQYLFWGVTNPELRKQMERINGGQPFGEGLAKWVTNADAFHLDKVQSPVRIEAMTPGSLIGEWELYSSLWLQHKPVDFIYYPDGQHQLQKPLERYASAQGNVDWFRFWLQGYERPNPEDPGQYKRWEHLRELHDADLKAAADQGQTDAGR